MPRCPVRFRLVSFLIIILYECLIFYICAGYIARNVSIITETLQGKDKEGKTKKHASLNGLSNGPD
jgi:hypothetical protein